MFCLTTNVSFFRAFFFWLGGVPEEVEPEETPEEVPGVPAPAIVMTLLATVVTVLVLVLVLDDEEEPTRIEFTVHLSQLHACP